MYVRLFPPGQDAVDLGPFEEIEVGGNIVVGDGKAIVAYVESTNMWYDADGHFYTGWIPYC